MKNNHDLAEASTRAKDDDAMDLNIMYTKMMGGGVAMLNKDGKNSNKLAVPGGPTVLTNLLVKLLRDLAGKNKEESKKKKGGGFEAVMFWIKQKP